eukprot:CAMPEP_0196824206 /NCGR_PEP_ID=MMETSP1362-20130617/90880_1 /TAXON_ID=163516 /ORGANISM="Leptocylindrus danicus, Strain CCMP1856" /LENGTH=420 /DNA_ID=CAMNT_0042204385 /DNA_START=186 /DNA_END=1448 /DNA_ORIENTATION=-
MVANGLNINIEPPKFENKDLKSVVSAAQCAIDGVLGGSHKPSLSKINKSNEQNELQGHNRGRLGIEIDGARFLLTQEMKRTFLERAFIQSIDMKRIVAKNARVYKKEEQQLLSFPERVVRRSDPTEVEVNIFEQSSNNSCDELERDNGLEDLGLRTFALQLALCLSQSEISNGDIGNERARPVAVYFSNVRLTLLASLELQDLKKKNNCPSTFDDISVSCIGADLPESLSANREGIISHKQRRSRLSKGVVDPSNGVVIVVGPSNHHLDHLQQLAANSAVKELPLVLISPRLGNSHETPGGEMASSYGGSEPPKHPWLLKDFMPPIFVWVADATSSRSQSFPRIALSRSIMDRGNAWHLFHSKARDSISSYDDQMAECAHSEFHYFASIPSAIGRPSKDMIVSLWKDWMQLMKRRQQIGE